MDQIAEIFRHTLHYGLHFLVPGLIAYVWYRKEWKKVGLILVSANLIDLDHLLANPIFDAHRCGIGFHVLHSEYAIILYVILLFIPKTRIIGIGLLLHIFADSIDCLWM